jgi:hypothetical protein
MQPNDVRQIVREVLREELGNYLVSDGKIIIPKSIQTFGKTAGVYGKSVQQAGTIAAPTSPGALYSQGQLITMETAINQIRNAIKDFGITL